MSKYTELDAKILQTIARGKNTFAGIAGHCSNLSFGLVAGDVEPWRIVDRRLQALRKAKKIVFIKGHWSVIQATGENQ